METYTLVKPKIVEKKVLKRKRKKEVILSCVPQNYTIYVCTSCKFKNQLNPTQYVVCQECRCRVLEKLNDSEKRVISAS